MPPSLSALLSFLEDEDDYNASGAMQELLRSQQALPVIHDYQDSPNANLRRRVQQLSSIYMRLEYRKLFQKLLEEPKTSFWDLCVLLNVIIDMQTSVIQINALLDKCLPVPLEHCDNSVYFRQVIKAMGLTVERAEDFYVTAFLVSDILVNNMGDLVPVLALAQRVAKICGWDCVIGRVDNVLCLRDPNRNVVYPQDDWKVLHPAAEAFHPCANRELVIHLLGKILTASHIDQMAGVTLVARQILSDVLQRGEKPAEAQA